MMTFAGLAAGLTALALAAAATPVARRLAERRGLVAHPVQDRYHRHPVPLGGGLAILLAILMPSMLAMALAAEWSSDGAPDWLPAELSIHLSGAVARSPQAMAILVGAVLLCAVGLVDDRRPLGPWVKLLAQAVVATATVLVANVRLLTMLGEPASSIVSILWLVTIVNATNFLDNVDGLAAGVTAICAAALLAAAASAGQYFVGAWLLLLIGACCGFLVHNFPPASVFMGDAGSLVLGYFLGVLSILTTYHSGGGEGVGAYYGVFAPVVVLAVPLYDMASVIVLRLRDRRNPMVGDTRHFSHRLLRRGMGPRKTVLTIYLATAATAVGAAVLPRVGRTEAVLVLAQTLAIVLLIALLESADAPNRR